MKLDGIKANFLGDSITEGCGTTDFGTKPFHALLGQKYNMTTRNYGIGGSRIARQTNLSTEWPSMDRDYCLRIDELDRDADLVVIFGGTNDYGHGDAPFGEATDRTPDTFIGACHYLFRRATELFPKARIVVLTPLHRQGENNPDTKGRVLLEYVNVIRDTAAMYSIPVIDLWSNSGIQPEIEVIREMFCPDGLHPNDEGHVRMADYIEAALLAL